MNDKKIIKRTIKAHWKAGVTLVVIPALLALFAWFVPACLTDQKLQIAAARKAWTNELTAGEKYNDDLAALITRMEIYKRELQAKGGKVAWEQQRAGNL